MRATGEDVGIQKPSRKTIIRRKIRHISCPFALPAVPGALPLGSGEGRISPVISYHLQKPLRSLPTKIGVLRRTGLSSELGAAKLQAGEGSHGGTHVSALNWRAGIKAMRMVCDGGAGNHAHVVGKTSVGNDGGGVSDD